MIAKSELPNIDWDNPDVVKLFEYVTGRFERIERDNKQLSESNKQLNKVNHQLEMKYRISQSENEQLRAQIAKLMGSQDSKTVANVTLKDATNTDSTPVEGNTLPKKGFISKGAKLQQAHIYRISTYRISQKADSFKCHTARISEYCRSRILSCVWQ